MEAAGGLDESKGDKPSDETGEKSETEAENKDKTSTADLDDKSEEASCDSPNGKPLLSDVPERTDDKSKDPPDNEPPKSSGSSANSESKKDTSVGSKELKEESKPQGKEPIGEGHKKLYSWLNKNMKIEMTDGRILIGVFLCTDRDGNVILGSCSEYINPEVCGFSDEPRILGLVMVPGRHIVSIHHDAGTPQTSEDRSNGLYS